MRAVVSPQGRSQNIGDTAESRGDRRKSAVLGKEIEKRLCWITKTKAVHKSIWAWRPGEVLGGGTPGALEQATRNEEGFGDLEPFSNTATKGPRLGFLMSAR